MLSISMSSLFSFNHLSIRFIVMSAFDIYTIFLRLGNDKKIISDIFHAFFCYRTPPQCCFRCTCCTSRRLVPADSVIDANESLIYDTIKIMSSTKTVDKMSTNRQKNSFNYKELYYQKFQT